MLGSISAQATLFGEAAGARKNAETTPTEGLSFDDVRLLFDERGKITAETDKKEDKEKKEGELTDAQRYMANNAKAMAMASMMLEDEEEEEKDDDDEGGFSVCKPSTGGTAGKSGKDNEAAKIAFSDKPGTSGLTDMEDKVGGGGGGTESEVMELPDGSKVMIIKTEITPGKYTTIKIPLSGPGGDPIPKNGDEDSPTPADGTAPSPASADF